MTQNIVITSAAIAPSQAPATRFVHDVFGPKLLPQLRAT